METCEHVRVQWKEGIVTFAFRLTSHQQLLTVGGEDDVGDGVGVVLHTLALHHFILK